MHRLSLALLSLILADLPAHANARQPSCPGFSEGRTSPEHIDQFYAKRAAGIISAGLNGDTDALAALVAPKASLGFWDSDSFILARQPGPPGVPQLVEALKPVRFLHPTPSTLVVVTSLKCAWTTTLLFRREQPDEGVNMTFDFVDGLLVKATGKVVLLTEGDIR